MISMLRWVVGVEVAAVPAVLREVVAWTIRDSRGWVVFAE